jgi:uncharacterized membrane protein (DUF4010 family)
MLSDVLASPLGGAVTATLIGLLLGLEREHSQRAEGGPFAGVRTFPILTLCGYVAARAADFGLPWVLATTLLAIGGLAIASYTRGGNAHVGATTEVLAILAPLLGATVAWRESVLASSIAILVTLLLTMKTALHRLAGAITEDEILAILKFGIVALIVVPLLPEQGLGPFDALVPRRIGMVVVVLSAVSLCGYLLVRTLGARAGWPLAGLMGGLVSSTAVAFSFSSKAREAAQDLRPFAVGIVLASTVLYLRATLLLAIFDPLLASHLAPRMGLLLLCGAALGLVACRGLGRETAPGVGLRNPTELGKAVALGLLFSGIVLAVRAAQARAGAGGVWATAALGGLVDVDSVAIAVADMRRGGLVSLQAAGGSILVASLANLVLKASAVAVIGGARLVRLIATTFTALAMLTLALLAAEVWL